nr:NAD(P)-binding domain-containing protein [Portibacter marinus]
MRVLVIGGGNMGSTYAEAMSKSKLLRKRNIMILDSAEDKVKSLTKLSHFDAFLKPEDCVPEAHIIFIAVKPYHSEELFKKIKPLVSKGQIVISIMAGVSIERIQSALGISKVVRAMPNLPAQIGKGMTSFTASPEVSKVELLTVENLIDTTGRSIYVDSEVFLDASTGIREVVRHMSFIS